MKGDFSRVTFRPARHYRSVLLQQGRVSVDADFNEEADILNARQDDTTADIIGRAGRPTGEFPVTIGGGTLNVGQGTLYLDGIPCVNDAPCTISTQPFLPLDSTAVANFPDLAAGAGTYAVYLRAFERLVTAVEDPEIRETALGGADTSVRSQLVWQVRLRQITPPAAGVTCANIGDAWKAPFTPGAMTARTVPIVAGTGPCVLPPNADYRSLENQLYRVEIHRGGPFATATFKWSRENGTVLTAAVKRNAGDTQTAGPVLSVATTGRDADIGFGNEQFVELLDDRLDLLGTLQPLSRIKEVRAALNEIELHAAATVPVRFANRPKLRRWDQQAGTDTGIPLTSPAPIALENGVAVSFAAGDYQPGDYWLIPARTAIDQETGTIQWPTDGVGNFLPQPSRHVEHTCLLSVVSWNGSAFAAVAGFDQCVPSFPPLTQITADGDCCTLVVKPGAHWSDVFNDLPPAGAHICFQAGTYTVDKRIDVQNKTTMVISGLGDAAKVVALNDECALRFVGCNSVIVRDLSAEGRVVQLGSGTGEGIMGVLAIKSAGDVLVENCRLTAADGPHRTTACLSVHTANRAIVRDNRLAAGVQQVGVLLSNVNNVVAEDNVIAGRPRTVGSMPALLNDLQFLAAIRTRLVTNLIVGPGPAGPPAPNEVSTVVGGQPVRFRAPATHVAAWVTLLGQHPMPGSPTLVNIEDHVLGLANQILQANAFPAFSGLRGAILGNITPSAQGLTVGGTVGESILIRGNRITSFVEGIHVGLSAPNPNVSVAQRVTIEDNRVTVTLGAGATRGRHGIYVGNVSSLKIRSNRLSLERPAGSQAVQIDGIRVFGRLGRSVFIRENHLDGFNIGVNFVLRGTAPATPMWAINDNLAEGSSPAVSAPNVANKSNNFG
jgi:Family of unknown function (DUF6519)